MSDIAYMLFVLLLLMFMYYLGKRTQKKEDADAVRNILHVYIGHFAKQQDEKTYQKMIILYDELKGVLE